MTWLGCLDIKLQRSTCLCFPSSNYKSFLLQSLDFYVGAGDLNSIPYACRVNTLPTELFPQPLAFGFDFLLFLSFLPKHSPTPLLRPSRPPFPLHISFPSPHPESPGSIPTSWDPRPKRYVTRSPTQTALCAAESSPSAASVAYSALEEAVWPQQRKLYPTSALPTTE